MLSQSDKEILKNSDFQRLVKTRRWLSWTLLLILLALNLAFGLLSVYFPALLARPVISGGVVPLGIAFGYFVLVLTFVFTLLYVRVANNSFESLARKIRAEVER